MDCSIWPDLDLGALTEEQFTRLGSRRYPYQGSLELTERCNLHCVHCYINQPADSTAARARELSTLQVATILDQIADAGCLFLLLTGGEVMLRPDFSEIYRHAVRKGLLITLFTNGTLLTPRMAELLSEWRPRRVEITLYGAAQATFESVTRTPGSYAACMRGIDLALGSGLPLSLKTMVLRANRHELGDMRAMAARLGVDLRYDGVLWPRTDGGPGPLAQRLSPREIVALDRQDPERLSEWRELAGSLSGWLRGDRVYGCGAGRRAFHVDCAGMLSACMMARRPAFDVLQDGFEQGWAALEDPINALRQLDAPCATCSAGAICSQCPGWSQMVHDDSETPVAFACELGRLRAALFDPCES
jgi:radical SAM protein with 4Fe4S-binding SPASM domain